MTTRTALITGGSAGLGLALTTALIHDGWRVITCARDADRLTLATDGLGEGVTGIAGDLTDPEVRAALVAEVGPRLDLLVHNASTLGASPLPRLADLGEIVLDDLWLTNVAAPVALTQSLLPTLRASRGVLLSISSDAAVEHYEGWGGYAATKAALDHLTLTFGVEEEAISAYAVDPGDLRTDLHQAAFPGEDISDRPLPESVVPGFLALLAERPANGRYRISDFQVAARAAS